MQPTFLHIIIPSWQLTVSMHQIGSLICNEHDKFGGENDNSVLNMHACRIPAHGLSFSLSKAYIKQVNRFQS